jgi:exodeoxyribonuclease VIII
MSIASHQSAKLPRVRQSAAARAAAPAGGPTLPFYALDGRPLQWSPDGKAVAFDSTAMEYFSDKLAVSSSALKLLARSPAHLRASMNSPREETASQRIGHAVHAAALEPALFRRDYVRYDGERRGRKWRDFLVANPRREILNTKEWETTVSLSARILDTVIFESEDGNAFTFGELRDHGHCERVIYWLDADTGLTCKARLDLMVGPLTLDVKTTDDAREDAFAYQCHRLGYDIQSAFYLRGRRALDPSLQAPPFIFVAAELAAPYAVVPHRADQDEFVNVGDKSVTKLLRQFKECATSFNWPTYPRPSGTLKLPFAKRFPATALNI